ncbi:MAG: FHA domain-containing protein [Woeseiaceae bacterium]
MSQPQMAQIVPATWAEPEPEPPPPFVSNGHRKALERLQLAFREERSLVALSSEGRAAAAELIGDFAAGFDDEEVSIVRISAGNGDAAASMREVIHGIGFEPKDLPLDDLEKIFRMFLSFQKTHRRRTILCVEDVPTEGSWLLDKLCGLARIEAVQHFGLLVVLSGKAGLNLLLNESPFKVVNGHGVERIEVAALTLDETRDYVRRRVESAGASDVARVFEYEAVGLMHELSAGVTDALGDLCTRCLDLAEDRDPACVTEDIVRQAAEQQAARERAVVPAAGGTLEIEAPRLPVGHLVVTREGEFICEQVINRRRMLIGRDRLCDVRLQSPPVSRYHALLINSPAGLRIVDLGSKNGTLVNRHRVRQRPLEDNDEIIVGDCTIRYLAAAVQVDDGDLPVLTNVVF